MTKTLKQIADELGIDKQRVYRFVKKNHITATSQVGQVKWYDEVVETLIKSAFLDNKDIKPHHNRIITTSESDAVQSADIKGYLEKEPHHDRITTSKSDAVMRLDEAVQLNSSENIDISRLRTTSSTTSPQSVKTDSIFTSQLEIKDSQIESLQRTLDTTLQLLDQEQQLHAQTKNDLSKMLENNQLLIEEKTKLLDLAQQKKWWHFWK